MPRMMRITTLVFVCASIAGCSWGGSDDGGGGGSPDASVNSTPVCGDSICSASEVGSCTQDCGNGGSNNPQTLCGNNTCETGETPQSCPNDCTGGGSGSGSGLDCNDQATQIGCLFCTLAQQCTAPYDAQSCAACGGLGGGTCNNDNICDPQEMLDPTCADCP